MKKIKYTDAPPDIEEALNKAVVIKNFLPSPDQLVFKEENVKVTLELSKRSVSLFKRFAQSKGFRYQRMIRNLVDQYAEKTLVKIPISRSTRKNNVNAL